MLKLILGWGVYFLALLFLSYYFIGVSFIKSVELSSLITIIHIVMGFIDSHYKRRKIIVQRGNCQFKVNSMVVTTWNFNQRGTLD
jgi:hypothetical protein